MIEASIIAYRNAYFGLSAPMLWLALVMFVNRAGARVLPFMNCIIPLPPRDGKSHFMVAALSCVQLSSIGFYSFKKNKVSNE